MRKFLVSLTLIFLLGKANSQGIYQPVTPTAYGTNNLRGVFRTALLIPSGCGVPLPMTSYSVDSSRIALFGDTCNNKLYYYNPRTRQWLLSGSTSIPWDSVSGKPANFPTTYALSNDVQDSIQARIAKRDSLSGGYTSWLLTKKKIDSLGAVVGSGFVTIGTDQDVTGRKSFTQGQIWFGSNQTGQSVGGSGSGIHFGNTNTLGGTSNIVLGFESIGSGNQGISIGFNANSGSGVSTNNIAIGQKATEYISGGSNNIAIGTFAANSLSTGSGNIALGNSAGHYIVGSGFTLQTNTNSLFIGANTRGSANGNDNEIVIGYNALGNGSNTATFGNSSITNNYFNGSLRTTQDLYFTGGNNNRIEFVSEDGIIYTNGGSYLTLGASGNASNLVFDRAAARWGLGTAAPTTTFDVNGTVRATALRQSSLASSIVKADANGVLEAAVAGTDFVAPSALSGYLPLTAGSGNALTGDLYISKSVPILYLNATSGTNGILYNTGASLRLTNDGGTTPPFVYDLTTGATSFGAELSGTSLSMSGAGSFLGNLGVGTASPSTNLHVVSTSGVVSQILGATATNGAFLNFQNVGSTVDSYFGSNNSTGTLVGGIGGSYGTFIASYSSRPIGFGINGTEYVRLTSSGNLGIGTTSPNAILEVMAVSEGEYFRAGGGTLSERSLRFSNYTVSGSAGVGHRINAPNAGANLSLAIAGTDALTIASTRVATFSEDLVASKDLTVVGTASGGIYLRYNGKSIFGRNGADNLYIPMLKLDASDRVSIDPNAYGTIIGGQLAFASASSRIVSGSNDFAINNNANTLNQLVIDNSTGAATFRSSVTAAGLSTSSGLAVTGSSTFTSSVAGSLTSLIRNSVTSASGTTGYGLAIESEASAATSYAMTVRNLAASQTYFHISTETGKVGLIGIGTNAPERSLEIAGSADAYIQLTRASSSFQSTVGFKTGASNDWLIRTDDATADLKFYSYGTSTYPLAISKSTGTTSFTVGGRTLKIGDGGFANHINWDSDVDLALNISNGGAGNVVFFGGTATAKVTLTAAGAITAVSTVTATGFIVSSDLRYKNILSQDGDLYTYTLKADETNQIHYGYIAQEVEKTLPFVVTTNSEGYKAVNYIEVHAIKIRELEKQIEELKKLIKK